MRPTALALLLAAALPLQGCLAVSVASAAGSVAALGVKTGARATGAAVGLAADGVGAAGHAVTGTGKRKQPRRTTS